jgi:hypothetical protein
MIAASRVFLLLIIGSTSIDVFAQSAGRLVTLAIAAPTETVRVGSDLKIKTKLTNTSNRAISFFDTNRECDYPPDVRMEDGRQAPRTSDYSHVSCGDASGRRIAIKLEPGQSTEDELIINQFYDLSRPGKYHIQVTRKLPKETGITDVKSNFISITISD